VAHAIWQAHAEARLKIHDADYEVSVAVVRNALGDEDFQSVWAEGAALSVEEAIAYAQHGRGERKRTQVGRPGAANEDRQCQITEHPKTAHHSTTFSAETS
jgi:hypothetical protein